MCRLSEVYLNRADECAVTIGRPVKFQPHARRIAAAGSIPYADPDRLEGRTRCPSCPKLRPFAGGWSRPSRPKLWGERRPIRDGRISRPGRRAAGDGAGRRAKYLLLHLDDGSLMVLHLGMSGRILISDSRPETLDPHDHVIFTTEDGGVVRFNDARRFGSLDLTSEDALMRFPRWPRWGRSRWAAVSTAQSCSRPSKENGRRLRPLFSTRALWRVSAAAMSASAVPSGLSPKRTAWTVGAARRPAGGRNPGGPA